MLHSLIQPRLQVLADRGLLTVMMENLLGNAWKYSAGRPVTEIRLSCAIHEKQSIYCISDNGAGFDMRYAGKLFKPFERLHGAEFQGSGIGLAIVERIVRRFNGRIWADSSLARARASTSRYGTSRNRRAGTPATDTTPQAAQRDSLIIRSPAGCTGRAFIG